MKNLLLLLCAFVLALTLILLLPGCKVKRDFQAEEPTTASTAPDTAGPERATRAQDSGDMGQKHRDHGYPAPGSNVVSGIPGPM